MKRVLLVEDDFVISMLLEKQIERLGYEVVSKVDTGEEAIEIARNEQPDLILMDIKLMGSMDGIETMESIRKFSNTPVIYLSGNADENTKSRARNTQPTGFLVKPVDMEMLKKTIHQMLEENPND